jgi:integrase/recombinase XerD
MKALFEEFLRERQYLRNLTPNTLYFYREVYHVFDKEGAWEPFSKQSLTTVIVRLKERGVKAGAINSYLRGCRRF